MSVCLRVVGTVTISGHDWQPAGRADGIVPSPSPLRGVCVSPREPVVPSIPQLPDKCEADSSLEMKISGNCFVGISRKTLESAVPSAVRSTGVLLFRQVAVKVS